MLSSKSKKKNMPDIQEKGPKGEENTVISESANKDHQQKLAINSAGFHLAVAALQPFLVVCLVAATALAFGIIWKSVAGVITTALNIALFASAL